MPSESDKIKRKSKAAKIDMEVYFQVITEGNALKEACEKLRKFDALGFDTETTALDPFEGEIRLVQLSSGNDTTVIDLKPFRERGDLSSLPELAPLREILIDPAIQKIAHNAKFDGKWVKQHLGVDVGGFFDTMLASQLISAGEQDRRHSLAEVSSYFLGLEMDKTQQVSDWSAPELSHSQVEYAARDAATMIPLRDKVWERLKTDELDRAAVLEFECVMPVAAMEQNGFYLDRGRWLEQLGKVKKMQSKLADELQDMLSAGIAQASLFGRAEINLDSQAQVSECFEKSWGPDPGRHSRLAAAAIGE